MTLTKNAFDQFRSSIGQSRLPPSELIANDDQTKQMSQSDGLEQWNDGPGCPGLYKDSSPPPLLESSQLQDTRLWVVRDEDVVHAPEHCAYGETLESGVIKHTNLTGGAAAFSGGELLFLDEATIVINGCSGRYGPRSKAELDSVARAFSESGYGVWSMGFDDETNRPSRFIGIYPEWIA